MTQEFQCPCESSEAAIGSPGPIDPDEMLLRLVPADYIDDNNGIDPKFYSSVYTVGLSTLRQGFFTQSEVDATVDLILQRLPEAERKENCKHAVLASVSNIRASATVIFEELPEKDRLNIAPGRVFCVADTPMEGRPSHADVSVSPGRFSGEEVVAPLSKTRLRTVLRKIFGAVREIPPRNPEPKIEHPSPDDQS